MPAGLSGKGERLMYYKNARIFASDFQFHMGSFQVEDGRFGAVFTGNVPEDAVDLQGATVIPGLVDVQLRSGADSLLETAAALGKSGVTSFVPVVQANSLAQAALEAEMAGSRLIGLRLEGFRGESIDDLRQLCECAPAPIAMAQLPSAAGFIGKASGLCTVSLGAQETAYEQGRDGFAAGATFLENLYCHLPLVSENKPGMIAAAVENPNVKAELVCARQVCHPALVRLAFAMFGPERMVLSSGNAEENLYQGVINAIRYGVPEADALRAATYNAACAVGAGKEVGMIAPGRRADFIVCRSDFSGKRVFIAGEEI